MKRRWLGLIGAALLLTAAGPYGRDGGIGRDPTKLSINGGAIRGAVYVTDGDDTLRLDAGDFLYVLRASRNDSAFFLVDTAGLATIRVPDSIGATPVDTRGLALISRLRSITTNQYSPSLVWQGEGICTTPTPDSTKTVKFRAFAAATSGAASPTGTWTLQQSIGGGAYSDVLSIESGGTTTLGGTTRVSALQQKTGSNSIPIYTIANWNSTSGTREYFVVGPTGTEANYVSGAGSAVFRHIGGNYILNFSGAQTGSFTTFYSNGTETALNGITHNLMDLQVGAASKFKVDNAGNTTIAGRLQQGVEDLNTVAGAAVYADTMKAICEVTTAPGGAANDTLRLRTLAAAKDGVVKWITVVAVGNAGDSVLVVPSSCVRNSGVRLALGESATYLWNGSSYSLMSRNGGLEF